MTSTSALKPNSHVTLGGYDWYVNSAGQSYSITPSDTGNTVRFQVDPGDVWSADPSTRYRSELQSGTQIANGTPISTSYVMNIQPGSVDSASWMVLGQFHQNDYNGEPLFSPPYEVALSGGKMQINIGYTGANGQLVYLNVFSDGNAIQEGTNYAMNIGVTFDPDGKGHLVVQRNGVTIVNYTGPLGYETQSSVYWKEGIYEAGDATTNMTVDYSNFSMTTGTAAQPPVVSSTPPTSTSSNTIAQNYTLYDNSGKIISTTQNTLDSSRALLSSTVVMANGAKTVSTYQIMGQAYTTMVQQYSAAGTLVGVTEKAASGLPVYIMTVNASGVTMETTYDTLGRVTQLETIATDGSSTICSYSAGALTQYQTYNVSGQLTFNEVISSTGAKTVSTYQIAGQPYTSMVRVYDATGKQTLLTEYTASGTPYYSQMLDANGATEYKSYYSNGNASSLTVANTDGSKILTAYASNGSKVSYQTLNAAGVMTLYETFNSSGGLSSKQIYNPDGSKEVITYGITGQAYTSTDRISNAAGMQTSLTEYTASGALYYSQLVTSSGATLYSSYYSNGNVSNTMLANTDGSKAYTFSSSAGLKTAYETVNASGMMTLYETFNSSGALTSKQIYNPDGSKEVITYGITGQAYASTDRISNAAGLQTSLTQYTASGTRYYSQVLTTSGATLYSSYYSNGNVSNTTLANTDGSKAYTFNSSAGLATAYETVNANGVMTLYETFNSSGGISSKQIYNANGSKEVITYGITGQAYTSTDRISNAAGTQTSLTEYTASGALYYSQVLNANGATESKSYYGNGNVSNWVVANTDGSKAYTFNSSAGVETAYETVNANGMMTLYETFNSSGGLASKQIYNADGSKEVITYGITGQAYTSTDRISNAAGTQTSLIEYAASGTRYYSQVLDTNGATEYTSYDTSGNTLSRTVANTDGSREITLYTAAGALKGLSDYTSSGALAVSEALNSDGSYSERFYVAGAQTTALPGIEVFQSYNTDKYIFGSNAGTYTINGFNAGSGATHDTIQISSSLATDYHNLTISQSGTSAVIHLSANENITLSNTAVSSLSSADFRFA